MPRVSNSECFHRNEQLTIPVITATAVENLPAPIGERYAGMAEYLKEPGELLSDTPYVAYRNMDMQHLDVKIGSPVSKRLPEKRDVRPGSLPEGSIVPCIYRGPYRDMAPVYTEMASRIEEEGLTSAGTVREHYYNRPEYPESKLLTINVMPVP